MFDPISTYRLQLHKGFQFADLDKIIDYLHRLGVKTVYASPIFSAVPGSEHGYDGIDPHSINPEIGSMGELERLSEKLKERGMGWLQDIVPNHMAFHPHNHWLMDVLEKGNASPYRPYFDIGVEERIMVPFLGEELAAAIQKGDVKIQYQEGKAFVSYFDLLFPVNTHTYQMLIEQCCPGELNPMDLAGENEAAHLKNIFGRLLQEGRIHLDSMNSNRQLLQELLDAQYYRLCHWQETDGQMNYRRFFTVNGLICMNMQDERVFKDYHRLVKDLVDRKIFQGLRVDHVDGLYDPASYLGALRDLAGEDVYISVEKILAFEEALPDTWATQGTTGYDFLTMVNNLTSKTDGGKPLSRYYYSIAGNKKTVEQQAREKKYLILYNHMRGELANLCQLFRTMELAPEEVMNSWAEESLETAIAALLVHLPVYRFYGNQIPLEEEESAELNRVFTIIRSVCSGHEAAVDHLHKLMTSPWIDEALRGKVAHFYRRCMQFSGPLMAKGVEDTLMYTFNLLVSRNEVGDSPARFGSSPEAFHSQMLQRSLSWPQTMNATATHDTKRGEDFRARLNVITAIPKEWLEKVKEWTELNKHLRINGMPDRNDEYFIYQNLLGSYPMDQEEVAGYEERLQAYLQKALREAKLHSGWTNPNEAYESAVSEFLGALLQHAAFMQSFHDFLARVIDHGMVNSLVQLIAKFTCPGIPDVYQGCELWDLSFVDPDNRRPVDYEKRSAMLEELRSVSGPKALWQERRSGKIKLWLTHKLLELRSDLREVFSVGKYKSLEVKGKYHQHILAYARMAAGRAVVVILPLHTAAIAGEPFEHDWEDTAVVLPSELTGRSQDLLLGRELDLKGPLAVNDLFQEAPFAIIQVPVKDSRRKAGVLLHISSLPSSEGMGDLGPSAYAFVDFLHRAHQGAWQVLPLNPTSEAQVHSPYSATSSMAGNPLFISPALLHRKGWLDEKDLEQLSSHQDGAVDFGLQEKTRKMLLQKAWEKVQGSDDGDYYHFLEKEAHWLNDFALFSLLRERHGGRPWNEWDEVWKYRDGGALKQLAEEAGEELGQIKWQQFLFHEQWQSLRSYAHERGVRIIGDLPFYVSYDSADVWAHPDIFQLDDRGTMLAVAGVPPDAFSADGQLWGMPVFNWKKLEDTGFEWWIRRLERNREMFDLVRLDHFRAFSAYWEVQAGEDTARNGKWIPVPGEALFKKLLDRWGGLPFIAEDLGDIDEPVYALRDSFGLPGMKVLQFAFGDGQWSSAFLPHRHDRNFVVYTGTHDNNTLRGWWENEADAVVKKRVAEYAGWPLQNESVANHFCRLAYSSVADLVMVPMQDLLSLGEEARMNRPSSVEGNWSWRMKEGQVNAQLERTLRKWTMIFGR